MRQLELLRERRSEGGADPAARTTGHPVLGRVPRYACIDRLSIELTRACAKGCSFCYNGSSPRGDTHWSVETLLPFILDCVAHGVQSISFGGGEPLQFVGLCALLERLDGKCFRSLTTNGLLLDRRLEELVRARPDKIHVSVHFPEDRREVERVARQVVALEEHGVRAGVNLLVRHSQIEPARLARESLEAAGIGGDRVLLLPMRGSDTPSPGELAHVAGSGRFQSVTCLLSCAASARFASVGWDGRVGWCSYTESRRSLGSFTFSGLVGALRGLDLRYCGNDDGPATPEG